jgi:hypothetical protein
MDDVSDRDPSVELEVPPRAIVWAPLPGELEHRLLEILEATPSPGCGAHTAFRLKEDQLTALFAGLAVADAHALQRRFTVSASDDRAAAQFSRLTRERRDRLVAFLADTRRRQARARAGIR